MASRTFHALALGSLGVLAACGPADVGDTDDEIGDGSETAGDTSETTSDGSETTGDGDGNGPVPIECEPAGGDPGQHLWTSSWAGASGYDDEGRGIDVDGAGRVIVGGITRTTGNGVAWNPWFSAFELDGTQLWAQELDLGESRTVDDVVWVGPDAFVSAGASRSAAVLSGYSGQASLQWEDQRVVPGSCDPEYDADAAYVDLSVGQGGVAVGMVAIENIGDLCYEVDAAVELRSFAGETLWTEPLPFATTEPQVALGDAILFATGGGRLHGFDVEGTSLWDAQDVPPASDLAIGRSGKLVGYRWDGVDGTGYVAERDDSGGVVWEKQFYTGADDRRVGDLAIDPCDDSIVFVGSESSAVWVMKLDANGDELWSTTLDLVADAADMALAVTIAGDGTIVVAGRQGESYAADLFVAAFAG